MRPDLIWASLTGYGRTGPGRRARRLGPGGAGARRSARHDRRPRRAADEERQLEQRLPRRPAPRGRDPRRAAPAAATGEGQVIDVSLLEPVRRVLRRLPAVALDRGGHPDTHRQLPSRGASRLQRLPGPGRLPGDRRGRRVVHAPARVPRSRGPRPVASRPTDDVRTTDLVRRGRRTSSRRGPRACTRDELARRRSTRSTCRTSRCARVAEVWDDPQLAARGAFLEYEQSWLGSIRTDRATRSTCRAHRWRSATRRPRQESTTRDPPRRARLRRRAGHRADRRRRAVGQRRGRSLTLRRHCVAACRVRQRGEHEVGHPVHAVLATCAEPVDRAAVDAAAQALDEAARRDAARRPGTRRVAAPSAMASSRGAGVRHSRGRSSSWASISGGNEVNHRARGPACGRTRGSPPRRPTPAPAARVCPLAVNSSRILVARRSSARSSSATSSCFPPKWR